MVLIPVAENTKIVPAFSPLLKIKEVYKGVDTCRSLENLNLSLCAGKIIGIFGERGSGKAALLDLVSGETLPSSGRIVFNGEDVTNLSLYDRQARGICCKGSSHDLHDDLTVLENLELLGVQPHRALFSRRGGGTYCDWAMDILSLVGLQDKANNLAVKLDDVEKCLLTSAVALTCRPSLYLLELPCLHSAAAYERIIQLFKRLKDQGLSVIFTAERLPCLLQNCDKVFLLNKGTIIRKDAASEAGTAKEHTRLLQYVQ